MSLEELFASPADNTGGAADDAAARLKEYSALTDNADRYFKGCITINCDYGDKDKKQ